MTDRPGLDFSFSGLKTFTRNLIEKNRGDDVLPEPQTMADICAGFQEAVVDTLVIKCRRAMQQTSMKTLVIAGGVSANQDCAKNSKSLLEKMVLEVFYARHEFCTDNGAMIAYAGCQRLLAGEKNKLEISATPRWPLDQLIQPTGKSLMDIVYIRDLRIETIIGIYDWEREVKQTVSLGSRDGP